MTGKVTYGMEAVTGLRCALLMADLVKLGVAKVDGKRVSELHASPVSREQGDRFADWWKKQPHDRQKLLLKMLTEIVGGYHLDCQPEPERAQTVRKTASFLLRFLREQARLPDTEIGRWTDIMLKGGFKEA